ncbi:Putative ribonuclease H protein At1g65750 [Linum perenne]
MVLRDIIGRVQYATTINLGRCSISKAEIRGIVEGMSMVWDIEVRRLEIQLDSTTAISILLQINSSHQHASLATRFQRLRERDWETKIVHVYREANHLTDCLAGKCHNLQISSTIQSKDNHEIQR